MGICTRARTYGEAFGGWYLVSFCHFWLKHASILGARCKTVFFEGDRWDVGGSIFVPLRSIHRRVSMNLHTFSLDDSFSLYWKINKNIQIRKKRFVFFWVSLQFLFFSFLFFLILFFFSFLAVVVAVCWSCCCSCGCKLLLENCFSC